MNKKIIVVLLVCLVIVFTECQNNIEKELSLDFDAQYIRTNGYLDGNSYPITSLIKSMEELNEYYTVNKDTYDLERKEKVYSDTTIGFLNAVDKYDGTYFKDNVLVLVILEEGSGSVRHDITDVIRNENLLEIHIKRIVPQEGTDDMAQWHMLIEFNEDTYNESDIKVILN